MSQKQESDSVQRCFHFIFSNPGVVLVILQWLLHLHWWENQCSEREAFFTRSKYYFKKRTNNLKKIPFSLFSSQMTEKGKNVRENVQIIPAYTSLLLFITNRIIFSYWIFSAHMKNKINLGDIVTFLALKLLWECKKLLLWI